MAVPSNDRPYMPGYGIKGPSEGTGLLPWAWATERLASARNYWLSTTTPAGAPHAMPVWAVWLDDRLWFSSSLGSRKIRNLTADPRCTLTTENADDPVIVEGTGEIITALEPRVRFLTASNAKYQMTLEIDFLDPEVNATVAVRPLRAFGMVHGDFTGSPTRWSFPR